MARNELYQFRSGTNSPSQPDVLNFRCIKLDKDFEVTGQYVVTIVNWGKPNQFMTCECFAGSKSTCRHRTMLTTFIEQDKIDSGALYEFDKDKWYEPPKQGDL